MAVSSQLFAVVHDEAAAPKGAPRPRRRDLLRRVTLHLCSEAGALSYTIVQDGCSELLVRFGFGVSSSAGQRSGRRRRPQSSPPSTSWRRLDLAYHYGRRPVAPVCFAGPIKGPRMPRDLAVDVVLRSRIPALCDCVDDMTIPSPSSGHMAAPKGKFWSSAQVIDEQRPRQRPTRRWAACARLPLRTHRALPRPAATISSSTCNKRHPLTILCSPRLSSFVRPRAGADNLNYRTLPPVMDITDITRTLPSPIFLDLDIAGPYLPHQAALTYLPTRPPMRLGRRANF